MNWKFWRKKPRKKHKHLVSQEAIPEPFLPVHFTLKWSCQATGKIWEERVVGVNLRLPTAMFTCYGCGGTFDGNEVDQPWVDPKELAKAIAAATKDSNLLRDIIQNKCPDCGSSGFFGGPSGGFSQNIQCANLACGSRFNVAPPYYAERIK